MTTVYLDSSALVKRYIAEEGSDGVDGLYRRAEGLDVQLAFSLWNIGEVLRAIARARSTGQLTQREAEESGWLFLRETLKFRALGALRIVPVGSDVIAGAIPLLLASRLAQPDAIQIATARASGVGAFLAADERLVREALREGLNALDPVQDPEAVAAL